MSLRFSRWLVAVGLLVMACPSAPVSIDGGCTDADLDLLCDELDACPADANKREPGVCGCGVADLDLDGDGDIDCSDACPANPLKVAPGVCGCDVSDADSDADGTVDCRDACPADANKTAAGVCGCGVSDADTDGDGTLDCNDSCPRDAAKTAPGVCGCGQLEQDSDGDGAPDCNDGCPADPAKRSAGACGCAALETDSDSDGTPDCVDLCVADPDKSAPGACGCGVSDHDTDNDLTADCVDGCPTSGFKTAAGVCGCAVPDTDNDHDGVPNCNDVCPNDAAKKTMVGQCGCGVSELDTDGDGTPNCHDGCPSNAAKTAAGQCGCSVADADTDGDGFANCVDTCPNDPAKKVPGVCGCGVGDVDTDHDGTFDCTDACPADPLKKLPGVCGCGKAEGDTDGDGKADCFDGCPNDALKTDAGVCGCNSPEFPEYTVATQQVMFTTSGLYEGKLGGLAGADGTCQRLAADAGLSGTFMAVLGDATTSARSRVHVCGGVRSVLGASLFTSQDALFPPTAMVSAQISRDERGAAVDVVTPNVPVWTGSLATGATVVATATCSNWTSSSGSGATGLAVDVSPGYYLQAGSRSCFSPAHLYCISQPPPTVVGTAVSPPSGLVDLSKTTTQRFRLLKTMSYGLPVDVSEQATWSVVNSMVGSVSNVALSRGVFTGVADGTTVVTANYLGQNYTANVRVVSSAHLLFVSSGNYTVGSVSPPRGGPYSSTNHEWYDWANDECSKRATAAGLVGTYYALNFGGRSFNVLLGGGVSSLLALTYSGLVVDRAGTTLWADAATLTTTNAAAPMAIDEFGNPNSGTSWTSSCGFDFLANGNVATYANTTTFDFNRSACNVSRHLICISQ